MLQTNFEAKKIAEHLKSLIDLKETKNLNFGIITFYREQVNQIYEELEKVGISLKRTINKGIDFCNFHFFFNTRLNNFGLFNFAFLKIGQFEHST